MLHRVLEPELMDSPLQVRAYAEADFSLSDNELVSRLEQYLGGLSKIPDSQSCIIDFGCGPGNISERISSRWPCARVIGVDGAKTMLTVALNRLRERRSDMGSLSYHCCQISDLASGKIKLDVLADFMVSNSLLHHLHDPHELWRAQKRMARNGAVVFHRDLRRPESLEKAFALQRKHLPEAPPLLIHDYLASLKAAFTVEEVYSQLQDEGLEHLIVEEVEDRYLEIKGTL